MTVKRAILYTMGGMAVLAVPCQWIIDPSLDNIASVCLVLASSLSMLVYVGCSDALKTQPLSTFAIFGFAVTTQLGALLIQTLAWTALRSSLYDPLYTFGTLAFYQAIAIAMHICYRFFSAPKPTHVQVFRELLGWTGLYRTPSCGALWIIGFVGLGSYIVYISETLYQSPIGKLGVGFNFLAWAPFLIPFYLLDVGDGYCNWKFNRVMLAGYAVLLVGLGLVMNTRGVMFFGIATIGLLYLLAGMRSDSELQSRSVVRLGALAVLAVVLANPLSDLVTAMAIARGIARGAPAIVKVEKTFEVWGRPNMIAAYRADQAAALLRKVYDEHYIDNPILARFVLTKYHDNSLHFAKRIVTDDANARLREVSAKFLWAVLPAPVLGILGVSVDKLELDYSMGDFLPYLTNGGPLGGHRVGSMLGQGIALFGWVFPFVFCFICLALFGLMNLLTTRNQSGVASISAVGLLQVWTYFIGGLSFNGLHDAFYFLVRIFWQTALIYVFVFAFARMLLRSIPKVASAPKVPVWQRTP